jgi:hypothetical protein
MRNLPFRFFPVALLYVSLLVIPRSTHAQSLLQDSLPDAPDMIAQSSSQTNQSAAPADPNPQASTGGPQGKQTQRILFIIPNFRAVSANTHLPPQSVKDKFVTASQDSFDYSAVIFVGLLSGLEMADKQTPEFGHGAAGYGRYYWHTFVDQTVENYCVEFIVPAIAREDTRYYTLGHGGFWKRTEYSLSRAIITRKDNGDPTVNAGEIVCAGMAAGFSNFYYPSRTRNFGSTGARWGTNIGIDAGTFMFKEFWPDINHAIFHSSE